MFIDLLKFSITNEAVESVCELLKERHQTQSVLISVGCVVEYLKKARSESKKANKYLKEFKLKDIIPSAVEHLYTSMRAVNWANEYLLKSIRELERQNEATREVKDVVKDLRKWNSKLTEAFSKLSDLRFEDPGSFIEIIKKDIKYRHVISLIAVDDIMAICPPEYCPPEYCPSIATHTPIRIISFCYEKKPYERTIGMACVLG